MPESMPNQHGSLGPTAYSCTRQSTQTRNITLGLPACLPDNHGKCGVGNRPRLTRFRDCDRICCIPNLPLPRRIFTKSRVTAARRANQRFLFQMIPLRPGRVRHRGESCRSVHNHSLSTGLCTSSEMAVLRAGCLQTGKTPDSRQVGTAGEPVGVKSPRRGGVLARSDLVEWQYLPGAGSPDWELQGIHSPTGSSGLMNWHASWFSASVRPWNARFLQRQPISCSPCSRTAFEMPGTQVYGKG